MPIERLRAGDIVMPHGAEFNIQANVYLVISTDSKLGPFARPLIGHGAVVNLLTAQLFRGGVSWVGQTAEGVQEEFEP